MQDKYIVKGYKGVMDLDLSSVDPKFHKEVIAQHNKDITEYKMEQCRRPPQLRYENNIVNAYNILDMDRKAVEQKANKMISKDRISSIVFKNKKNITSYNIYCHYKFTLFFTI